MYIYKFFFKVLVRGIFKISELSGVTYPWMFQLLLIITWKTICSWFGLLEDSCAEFLLTAVELLLISSKKDNLICRLLCKSCYKLNLEPTGLHVPDASVQLFHFSHEKIPVKVIFEANLCPIGFFLKTKQRCSVTGRYIFVPSCFECSFDVKSLFNRVLCH